MKCPYCNHWAHLEDLPDMFGIIGLYCRGCDSYFCPTCLSDNENVIKLVQLPFEEHCPHEQWDLCKDPWHFPKENVCPKTQPR